ncbi:ATP-binding protein [Pseudomonas fluorescens]|uniref:ATP-binding protein n=1 Tax=Pseudomonas fluorescens TaxID=294 RepID=UPI00209B33EC|nr:ATP-binding protein [Pseudomonas fluorescens]MCO7627111.1 ATP-binding protein [Pseudomonas fluorescens]
MTIIEENFEAWDPLESTAGADPGILISAQRREIANILRSYTGYYDLFSELIQNALDAVEKRINEESTPQPTGEIWVHINLQEHTVQVTDNGCAMDLQQIRQFLKPNFSFKSGAITRGSKGVGATYLGYGFNSLKISSKLAGKIYSGLIENGRSWVDDTSGTIARPKIIPCSTHTGPFSNIDQGTSITISLRGDNIRPRNLAWYQATTAPQWIALLRIMTAFGGLYMDGSLAPLVKIKVRVIDSSGVETAADEETPQYLYPHTIVNRSGSIMDFLADQQRKVEAGGNPGKIAPKFKGLNGLWGQWTTAELLGDKIGSVACPIRLQSLDAEEKALARSAGVSIYVYLAFSTDLWDNINDKQLQLRKGARVLHGGLQLATRHMPQGMPLTIPMTNNIGFQNLVHVVVHFDNAEPDLGRKGFQPEFVQLAEKISVSAVTAFRRRYDLLRKPGAAKIFNDELKIDQWIKNQELHEQERALIIKGPGLFMPTEELPIRSEPLVEQDVVALFNQMLSSGLIRGVQLIASSQYNQYDGLYRIRMDPPFDKFLLNKNNPLGIESEILSNDEPYVTKVKVLEYKFTLDGLIEELQGGVKYIEDIGLVVVWEMGLRWKEMFDATCLLDEESVHHRQIHGTTHSFTHSVSGAHAFEAIILRDLVNYLSNPEKEVNRQRLLIGEEI